MVASAETPVEVNCPLKTPALVKAEPIQTPVYKRWRCPPESHRRLFFSPLLFLPLFFYYLFVFSTSAVPIGSRSSQSVAIHREALQAMSLTAAAVGEKGRRFILPSAHFQCVCKYKLCFDGRRRRIRKETKTKEK